MPSLAQPDAIHLGIDVHKDSISVGILNPGHESADVEKIFNDEESVPPDRAVPPAASAVGLLRAAACASAPVAAAGTLS